MMMLPHGDPALKNTRIEPLQYGLHSMIGGLRLAGRGVPALLLRRNSFTVNSFIKKTPTGAANRHECFALTLDFSQKTPAESRGHLH